MVAAANVQPGTEKRHVVLNPAVTLAKKFLAVGILQPRTGHVHPPLSTVAEGL